MSRKPRLEFKGAIYHVFQRGNNKEHIFCDPIEKGYFIKQIKDYMSIYNFELFAYVIMDNHYHLILRTNEAALNKIMHSINNVYSKLYNYRHKRTGHVFEERYNSKPDRKTLDEIINIMGLGQVEYDLIKSGSRKRHLIDLKLLFIVEALKYKYTHKEIGEFVGISQSAVTKLLKNSKIGDNS